MIDVEHLQYEGEIWLGGTGKMYRLTDGEKSYIFKPAYKKHTTIEEPFRAHAQEAAYELQKIIDPQSAVECRVATVNGMYGTVQEEIEVDKNFTYDIKAFQLGKKGLSEDFIKSLMREYITDYLLCNYDSHARNFIVGTDGILRGVDKEQAFKYMDYEGSDDPRFSINFNNRYGELPSIYSVIFQKIEQGELSPEILTYADEYIKRISDYPSEEYKKIFKKYAEALDPKNQEAILDGIVERKETLSKVMSKLKDQYKDIGRQSEDRNLEVILNEVMKLPYITSKTKQLAKALEYQEHDEIEAMLIQAFNYCIILRDSTGVEEFMETKGDEAKFRFLQEKVAQKLGIPLDKMEERKDEIYKCINDGCTINGFAFHVTNSVAEEEIKKTGLSGTNRIWNIQEFTRINSIYERYGKKMSLGWGALDIKRGGWFCDLSASGIPHYSSSPEWMEQFCGGSIMYYGDVPQDKRRAFYNRDYDTALDNITTIHNKLGFDASESEEVINFFNKYWNIYKDAIPKLIMIPRKEIKVVSIPYDWLKEKHQDDISNGTFYKNMERKLMDIALHGRQFKEKDICIQENVPPEKLLFVDISSLFERKKLQKRENVEGELIFGKHEQIPYEEKYKGYFHGLRGYDDLYCLRIRYPDAECDETKKIKAIVDELINSRKIQYPYFVNVFGEATADNSEIVGGMYFKPQFLEEIVSMLSEVKGFQLTGMEDSKEKASEYKAELDLDQLMKKIKGLDVGKRETAIKLIDMLSKGMLDLEQLPVIKDK